MTIRLLQFISEQKQSVKAGGLQKPNGDTSRRRQAVTLHACLACHRSSSWPGWQPAAGAVDCAAKDRDSASGEVERGCRRGSSAWLFWRFADVPTISPTSFATDSWFDRRLRPQPLAARSASAGANRSMISSSSASVRSHIERPQERRVRPLPVGTVKRPLRRADRARRWARRRSPAAARSRAVTA
jgi:hypothetical protein